MNDSEFERTLLQSARGDSPPMTCAMPGRGSPAHWADGVEARDRRQPDRRQSGGRARPSLARRRPDGRHEMAIVGCDGGSAATAAVMLRVRTEATLAPTTAVVQEPTPPANVVRTSALPSRAIAADAAPPSLETTPLSPLARRPRRTGRGHARARQDAIAAEGSDSTLAAEVSRIDAARTANAAGDYDEAVWLIARYHRDFPDGALAPDADVVALEAVAAKRDRPETARRAALFLSRYPDDPHTEKVKRLAAHLSSDQR